MSENGPCTCPKCHKLYWCHLPHPNMCDDCWKKEQMSEPVKSEPIFYDEDAPLGSEPIVKMEIMNRFETIIRPLLFPQIIFGDEIND